MKMENNLKKNKRNNVKNNIFWEFWLDPFDNMDKFHVEEETEDDELDNLYGGKYEEIGYNEENSIIDTSLITKKPYRIAITQVGAIPFYENTLPSKIFKFWVGHTNFNISQKVAKAIEKTEGVETLDVFTRYRFRIGVGKAFDSREVRKEINNNVLEIICKKDDNSGEEPE